ncbi:hypothetical protein N0V95_000862 [Ascochyta clinopodiicola]|nr:hypothetical protein N0V95_000862 [Ascochyta clinopodiicola]
MSISNRLPYGVAREQAQIAQQNRNNAPSNWPESSRSPPAFREGDPIRKVDATCSPAGDIVEELREPLVEGELTIHGKKEVVVTTRLLKKTKTRRRITKKLERVKRGWAKSKRFVREKGKAVIGTLGWLNGSTANSETSESVRVVTAPLESVSHDRPDVPSPLTLSTLKLSERAKSDTRLGLPIPAKNSDIDGDQASLASRRTEEMMEASGPAYSLNTIVAGPPNKPTQQADQNGKRPVQETELMLQCRFCSAKFSGEGEGDDALLLHVMSSHSEKGGKPSQDDKPRFCQGEEEEDSLCDEDELFPQCQYCPHTFSSDKGRLRHQAEAHPDEMETFPQCGHCEATFETEKKRDRHVEEEHPHCRHCGAVFYSKTVRDEHEQSAHLH